MVLRRCPLRIGVYPWYVCIELKAYHTRFKVREYPLLQEYLVGRDGCAVPQPAVR